MEYSPAIKKSEILSFLTTWIDLAEQNRRDAEAWFNEKVSLVQKTSPLHFDDVHTTKICSLTYTLWQRLI